MIRFYVMAIDTIEPAAFSWQPAHAAAQQTFTDDEFRALNTEALADECHALLNKAAGRDKAPPRKPAAPADGKLFPDAGPIRPYDEDDPDGWRRELAVE